MICYEIKELIKACTNQAALIRTFNAETEQAHYGIFNTHHTRRQY